jgi:radical SAM protein with 4Fe4S-binding SPASM domain
MDSKADILIVTVTKVESKAVMHVFKEFTGKDPIPMQVGDRIYHDLGKINNQVVFMALSEMGSSGLGGSQETVRKGIEALKPNSVIMIGIAFGINEHKQAIGDILVSQQLWLYDLQRVGKEIIPRGDKPHASTRLINLFQSADLYWDEAKVRFGLILTGAKLVDNMDYRDQLKQFEPEAIGGEMEGAGLYVACQDSKVDWILVKAICDWADGNKGQDKDQRQQLAAHNAASFVLHTLQTSSFKQEQEFIQPQPSDQARPSQVVAFKPHTEFVGRSQEKRVFRQLLYEAVRKAEPRVMLVIGQGGIGKSWLLQELCAECQTKGFIVFFIDLAQVEPTGTSAKQLLYEFRTQADTLGLAEYLKSFDEIDKAIVTAPEEWPRLTAALIKGLNAAAQRHTLVVAIDSSERAINYANWLRQNLLGRLSGQIMIVLSGRRDNVREFTQAFGARRLKACYMEPFDDDETKRYFHYHNVKLNDEEAVRIREATQGNPLATGMVITTLGQVPQKELPKYLDKLPEGRILADLAEHLLNHLTDADRNVVYAMSCFRFFDDAALTYALGLDEKVNVEKLAQRLTFTFLRPASYGWSMHDELIKVISDYVQKQHPSEFRHIHERAAEFWQSKIESLEAAGVQPPEQYSHVEWTVAVNLCFWHLLRYDQSKAEQFLSLHFGRALSHQIYFVTLLEEAEEVTLSRNLRREVNNLQTIKRSTADRGPGIASYAIRDCGDFACDCACDCACPLYSSLPKLTYYLEITPDCNNACYGCYNLFASSRFPRLVKYPKPYLHWQEWEMILANIVHQTSSVRISGGEPTLHPDFERIIATLACEHIPFSLFTNGRWSNPNRLMHFLKSVPECLGLLISLHGMTAEAHETFSGVQGSFNETLANIKLAIESNLNVSISMVLTPYNYRQIHEMVRLAQNLGARVVFNRHIDSDVSDKHLSPTGFKQAVEQIETLKQQDTQVRFGPCIPTCFVSSSATGCLAGTSFAAIDPWGNVKPCTHAPLIVGNLLKQSQSDIWNSEGMMVWDALVPSGCHNCNDFNICHGGCRASALLLQQQRDPLIVRLHS